MAYISKYLPCVHGLCFSSLQSFNEVDTMYVFILQSRKIRLREFNKLAQGHTVRKQWDLNPGRRLSTVSYSALLKEMRDKKVLSRAKTVISM